MAASSYDAALARLLAHEGGYSNHPADPGGPTNFGITIADYRRYADPHASAADVRAMKVAAAKAIYRSKYWDALRADALPAGLDYAVFDYGVNSGIARAAGALRKLAGCAANGHGIDEKVLTAVDAHEPRALIVALSGERLEFLRRLKTWPVFGAGWGRRVTEVKAAALALAAGPLPSPPPSAAPARGIVPASIGAPHDTHNIHWLQQRLNAWGATPQLVDDGQYGLLTRTAVAAFQRRHGLLPDGLVGPRTRAALERPPDAPSRPTPP